MKPTMYIETTIPNLLTWNCRHIHNAFIKHRLQGVCEALGLSLPTLCTPPELMADYLQA
jgi:hypothetical protein